MQRGGNKHEPRERLRNGNALPLSFWRPSGLLEVVDAVVFRLGDAEKGAVAELGGEGDLVCDVGPGLEVRVKSAP